MGVFLNHSKSYLLKEDLIECSAQHLIQRVWCLLSVNLADSNFLSNGIIGLLLCFCADGISAQILMLALQTIFQQSHLCRGKLSF